MILITEWPRHHLGLLPCKAAWSPLSLQSVRRARHVDVNHLAALDHVNQNLLGVLLCKVQVKQRRHLAKCPGRPINGHRRDRAGRAEDVIQG